MDLNYFIYIFDNFFIEIDVSNRGEDGMTPLHFAARFKRTKTVTYTDEDGNEVCMLYRHLVQ